MEWFLILFLILIFLTGMSLGFLIGINKAKCKCGSTCTCKYNRGPYIKEGAQRSNTKDCPIIDKPKIKPFPQGKAELQIDDIIVVNGLMLIEYKPGFFRAVGYDD